MFRSPFPDVEIPNVPLTDFVLARAGGLGDRPALIDGPSGRTITYAQLAESVARGRGGAGRRAASARATCSRIYAPNLPEYAVAFHAVRDRPAASTRPPTRCCTADELAASSRDCRRAVAGDDARHCLRRRPRRPQAAGVRGGLRVGEADGATPFASLLATAGEPPDVAIDPADDLVALPVLQRHHRAAEGRDADPPQPGRERPASTDAVCLDHGEDDDR